MPICEKRKIAFCHIPRTGGVSISNALGLKVMDKHYPVSFYREMFPDYKVFTILRPYEDRVKSAFGWIVPERRKEFISLDELTSSILQLGMDNLGLMLKPNEYFLDKPVDFTLRFGHLQRDLDSMLRSIGHESVPLVKCNTFRK